MKQIFSLGLRYGIIAIFLVYVWFSSLHDYTRIQFLAFSNGLLVALTFLVLVKIARS